MTAPTGCAAAASRRSAAGRLAVGLGGWPPPSSETMPGLQGGSSGLAGVERQGTVAQGRGERRRGGRTQHLPGQAGALRAAVREPEPPEWAQTSCRAALEHPACLSGRLESRDDGTMGPRPARQVSRPKHGGHHSRTCGRGRRADQREKDAASRTWRWRCPAQAVVTDGDQRRANVFVTHAYGPPAERRKPAGGCGRTTSAAIGLTPSRLTARRLVGKGSLGLPLRQKLKRRPAGDATWGAPPESCMLWGGGRRRQVQAATCTGQFFCRLPCSSPHMLFPGAGIVS